MQSLPSAFDQAPNRIVPAPRGKTPARRRARSSEGCSTGAAAGLRGGDRHYGGARIASSPLRSRCTSRSAWPDRGIDLRWPASCWRRGPDGKGRRTELRRPESCQSRMGLRAGVPQAVIAEISPTPDRRFRKKWLLLADFFQWPKRRPTQRPTLLSSHRRCHDAGRPCAKMPSSAAAPNRVRAVWACELSALKLPWIFSLVGGRTVCLMRWRDTESWLRITGDSLSRKRVLNPRENNGRDS
jgi:hypothetical protein